jgi:hypothetical protein
LKITVNIAREEKSSGWFRAKSTSSWRERQKQSDSGAKWTGAWSRSSR